MDVSDVYAQGLSRLDIAWNNLGEGESPGEIPSQVAAAIAKVMSPEAQVSQRYALPTQLLLKLVTGDPDGRRLEGIPSVTGPMSARSFAKQTVVAFKPLSMRLGFSADPYVSNPLRRDRLHDEDFTKKGKEVWQALFSVIDYVDQNPEETHAVFMHTIAEVKDRPAQPIAAAKQPVLKAHDLPALVKTAGVDQDMLLDIIDVLQSEQPQVILAGPPGTSKTHVAVAIAQYLTGDNTSSYKVVQLHASYGYEEFVEGIRPKPSGDGFEFTVQPGAIRRLCNNWKDGDCRVLVMDEMNRANLPRVLGELLYALERRDSPIDLMYSENFSLPAGLAVIGTMNTADRSIRSIDAAVRRRFQIFDFPPNGDVLEAFYVDHANEIPELRQGLDELNALLTELLDRHHTIGHTFLMKTEGMNPTQLRQTWDRQILPLIEEYLFDQSDILGEFRLERFWPSVFGG
ncbi:MAG: restriction endonuclease, SacI family [Fimbriimonadaceae bacterium]|nr:restriction endonuclease, SacI family [Fimbriimonadaceae bacterium]